MGPYIDRSRFPETIYFRRFGDVMTHDPSPMQNDRNGGHFIGRWLDGITFENFDGDRLIFPAANNAGLRSGAIEWSEQ
jgi:hypothetical protein